MTDRRLFLLSFSMVVAAACHPPSLSDRMMALKDKAVAAKAVFDAHPEVAAIVKAHVENAVAAGIGAKIGVTVTPAVLTTATGTTDATSDDSTDAPADGSTDAPAADDGGGDAVATTTAPSVPTTVTVTRKVGHASTFVLHGRSGTKDTCQAFTTMDACSASCSSRLRQAMSVRGSAQVSCSCVEQSTGC